MNFRNYILETAKMSGLNLGDLASKAGYDVHSLSRYVNENIKPSEPFLRSICNIVPDFNLKLLLVKFGYLTPEMREYCYKHPQNVIDSFEIMMD